MGYHVVRDSDGLLRAVAYRMVWSEKHEDPNTGDVAYPIYATTADGTTFLMQVFSRVESANEYVNDIIMGKGVKLADRTTDYVERL